MLYNIIAFAKKSVVQKGFKQTKIFKNLIFLENLHLNFMSKSLFNLITNQFQAI